MVYFWRGIASGRGQHIFLFSCPSSSCCLFKTSTLITTKEPRAGPETIDQTDRVSATMTSSAVTAILCLSAFFVLRIKAFTVKKSLSPAERRKHFEGRVVSAGVCAREP